MFLRICKGSSSGEYDGEGAAVEMHEEIFELRKMLLFHLTWKKEKLWNELKSYKHTASLYELGEIFGTMSLLLSRCRWGIDDNL